MPRIDAPTLASLLRLPYARGMARRRPAPPAPVSDDDAALFRTAIGEVRELESPPPPPSPARPLPKPRQRDADEAAALEESHRFPQALEASLAGESVEHRQESVSARVLRQLKRGQFSVQDEIDLHRMTAATAEQVLRRFLHECRDAGHLCVRIVHGKGLNSGPEGPVLRGLVEHWLRRRADVLAFATAPAAQGGSGAVLALLAPRRVASTTRDR
jgi:DNA-nicking Smr family endonuclease